jgi:hypothetical protein
MSISQRLCLFVALSIQNAMRLRQIVICGLPRSTIFPHYLIKGTILEKKVIEYKMCVSSFSTTFG